jgi:polyisoprenoid-binding protein YceI
MSSTLHATLVPTGSWELDPVHSGVGFEVGYLGGTFKGTFRTVEAKLVVGDDAARLEGSAQVASVDVRDENLAAHLQSPDFFDAERHPEIAFTARDIDLDGDTVTVAGDLTIKGVTLPAEVTGTVVAPLTDAYGRERVGLVLRTQVDRTQFGVSWNNPLPNGELALANDVAVVADLYFVKAA